MVFHHFPSIKILWQSQWRSGRCLVVLRLRGLCAEAMAGMAECSLKGWGQTTQTTVGPESFCDTTPREKKAFFVFFRGKYW